MSETLAEPAVEETAPEVEASTETPTVETPAPAAYDPTEDPRVLDLVDARTEQRIQALIEQARTQAATPQAGAAPDNLFDEFGNLDPAAFAAYLAQRDEDNATRFERALAQVTQPLHEQQLQATIAEGEQQMRDVIADLGSREGELIGGDVVVSKIIDDVRNRYFPEIAERFGQTNRAAEMAIERAYRAERDYQKQIADAAVERHVNRNAELAGVRTEPGLGAGSGVVTRPDTPYKEGELARKYGASADRLRAQQ